MAIKFKVTQFVREYVKISEDNWDYVEVRKKYECPTYDDLQNLLLTLTECSVGSVKFEIRKEEVTE